MLITNIFSLISLEHFAIPCLYFFIFQFLYQMISFMLQTDEYVHCYQKKLITNRLNDK